MFGQKTSKPVNAYLKSDQANTNAQVVKLLSPFSYLSLGSETETVQILSKQMNMLCMFHFHKELIRAFTPSMAPGWYNGDAASLFLPGLPRITADPKRQDSLPTAPCWLPQ